MKNETITTDTKTAMACKVCGCTDNNCIQCIEKIGKPCHWVESDLCSACVHQPNVDDAIQFLKHYRAMELNSKTKNREIIKHIVDAHIYQHTVSSWERRNNDFGEFFLNLDHECQGLLLQQFGLKVDGLSWYIKQKDENPISMLFVDPPVMIMFAHRLHKFFYNNGIDEHVIPNFKIPDLPDDSDIRYGNSTNWANFILYTLRDSQSRELLQALMDYLLGMEHY